ncbi:MAG: DUF302 domain-containing protein [Rhodobacteraceae bacterium]|nr:DUF302 domain-containing protein [Paracoccaceae bacterium]
MRNRVLTCLAAGLIQATPMQAQDATVYPFEGTFEDATFAVENAIVGRGLVIDYVSHVGEMLNRTGSDVGSTTQIFKAADAYLFCSAVVSREVMEADKLNVTHCPYSVFVFEDETGVQIGHRNFPSATMQKVQALLVDISQEAAAN